MKASTSAPLTSSHAAADPSKQIPITSVPGPTDTPLPTLASLWTVSEWSDVATRLGVPVTSTPGNLPELGEGMCGSVRGTDTLAFKCSVGGRGER